METKNGPSKGAIFTFIVSRRLAGRRQLVGVPVTAPDHDTVVAIVMAMAVPSAMQAAIMLIEPEARAAMVAVAVIVAIAANVDAESRGAGHRGRTDGDGCKGRQCVSKLPHCSISTLVAGRKRTGPSDVAGNSEKLS